MCRQFVYDPFLDYDFPTASDDPREVLTPDELDAYYRDMQSQTPAPPPADAELADMARSYGYDPQFVPF